MRIALVLLLCLSLVAAAEVVEKNSGIVRGSLSYQFEYDPADMSTTVIDDVGANDLITIIYGTTKSGLPIKYELFFKTPLQGVARWDVIGGAKALSASAGETVELDIDGDRETELLMTYEGINERRFMTFSIRSPDAAGAVPTPEEPAEPEAPVETPEEPSEVPSEPSEVPSEPAEPSLPETVPPQVVEPEGPNVGLIILVVVVVIFALGIAFFYFKGEDEDAPKAERREKPVEKPRAVPRKHTPQIVTRSRRR